MQTIHALQIAERLRVGIDAHVDRALQQLNRNPAEARHPLALARWQLVQMLRRYHLFKKVEIFNPAMRAGSVAEQRKAGEMLAACRAGWTGYCAYTREWSSQDIVATWPSYTAAMLNMSARLHEQLGREERLIRGLLGDPAPEHCTANPLDLSRARSPIAQLHYRDHLSRGG